MINKKFFNKIINFKTSKALERQYYSKLKDISEKINKSVLYWGLAKYNQTFNKNVSKQLTLEFNSLLKEWNEKVSTFSENLSKDITKNVEKYVNLKFINEDKDFDIKLKSKNVKDELQAIYESNLALIKTIPQNIIERYRISFLNNINNFDREAIYKMANSFNLISKRRAKVIARDQTQKAVVGYTQARAQQLGFQYYIWLTSNDERVSKGKGGHDKLNNRIYKYDNPTAIIDSYGNIGEPSKRVNCRCIAAPFILKPGVELILVKDSVAGDYYKVKN